jgi:hypothetical protein
LEDYRRTIDIYCHDEFYIAKIIDMLVSNNYKGQVVTISRVKFVTDKNGDTSLVYKSKTHMGTVWEKSFILEQPREVKVNNLELLMYTKQEIIEHILLNDKTISKNVRKVYKRYKQNRSFKIHNTTFFIANIKEFRIYKNKPAKQYMAYLIGLYKGYAIQSKIVPIIFTDNKFRKLKYLNEVTVLDKQGKYTDFGDGCTLTEVEVPDELIERDKLHKMSLTIEKLLKRGYLYNESVIEMEKAVDNWPDKLRRHNVTGKKNKNIK